MKNPSPCHSALRFVHHTPAADGLQDLDVPDAGRIDGFNITVEQYKIGKTARLDAPAVVFPAAAKGSIGRVGFQRLTRGNALIAPEQDTAVADAVYRRVHTAEGGHRKDGRIHMQREGHTQTDAGTGGVHARGALGAKENGGVPISPDFDVPGEQTRDDPASLHALKLRVGNELRMDEHVAQIRARAPLHGLFKSLDDRFRGGVAVGMHGDLKAEAVVLDDDFVDLFLRPQQRALVAGAGVVVFKQRSGEALNGAVGEVFDPADLHVVFADAPHAEGAYPSRKAEAANRLWR